MKHWPSWNKNENQNLFLIYSESFVAEKDYFVSTGAMSFFYFVHSGSIWLEVPCIMTAQFNE